MHPRRLQQAQLTRQRCQLLADRRLCVYVVLRCMKEMHTHRKYADILQRIHGANFPTAIIQGHNYFQILLQ